MTQSDEEEDPLPKKKGKRLIAMYNVVECWLTGDRAEEPEEDIEREILDEVCCLMAASTNGDRTASTYGDRKWAGRCNICHLSMSNAQ